MAERIYSSPMTCVLDGLAHEVTDETVATSGAGIYTAVCGHEVHPAGLTAPTRSACAACVRRLLACRGLAPSPPSRARPGRHRRPNRFLCLVRRSS